MQLLDNNKISNIHFIGINGSSMSGLAEILIGLGYFVTGSDIEETKKVDYLRSLGAIIHVPQDEKKIGHPDLIVYTAAISKDNCEFIYAKEQHIELMNRKDLLAKLMVQFKYGIGVSGTHGKTTTTTFVAYLLEKCGFDPTIHIGGEAKFLNSNVKVGNSEYFVTEADEFTDSFLALSPYIGIILNIEHDHVDYFPKFEDMKRSFLAYAKLIHKDGYLIVCDDDENIHYLYEKVDCKLLKYGLNNKKLDYTAMDLSFNELGYPSFTLIIQGKEMGQVTLGMPGKHNVLNVLSAIATCHVLEGDIKKILKALVTLSGAKRRLDVRADINGIKVIADYAHHPTEIKVTLETVSNMAHNEIYAIFEPHTFSRVRYLYDDFVTCFSQADHVILAPVYNDREKEDPINNSMNLAKDIKKSGKDAIYLTSYDDIRNHLIKVMKPGDIIMILGSKFIEGVANQLGDYLRNQSLL
ncbi:MAG: UDP-N-acetylmuramate--L-alanine ligase [Clostridiales bacterium]|nr:UDP-N-acetylmuramate--L-alanine ligase [Clostridiales bacterium]